MTDAATIRRLAAALRQVTHEMRDRRRIAEMYTAWTTGRNARIRGLDVKQANVECAQQFGWRQRSDFDDRLLDECERGWNAEDLLKFSE